MASISSKAARTQATSILARKSMVAPRTFTKTPHNLRNHQGGQVYDIDEAEQLRRSVLSCMLWEDTFYESGETVANRIARLIPLVDPQVVSEIAYEARTLMKLRHVPLFVVIEMLKHPEHKKLVRKTVSNIIQRPDEMSEILMLYWAGDLPAKRDNEMRYVSQRMAQKLPEQLRRGIRDAFEKFDGYSLTKYLERDKPVTMADIIRVVHPDPRRANAHGTIKNGERVDMSAVYKQIVSGTATAPDTWESQLSAAGKSAKGEIFTGLLKDNKLGAMALLRNLRGMQEAGVDLGLIRTGLDKMNVERVLPYRFVTAVQYAPKLKTELENAMYKCVEGLEKLPGKTILLVDISPSMQQSMSQAPRKDGRPRQPMTRLDGATGLSILTNEICESADVYLFNFDTFKVSGDKVVKVNLSDETLKASRSHRGMEISAPGTSVYTDGSNLRGFSLGDAIRSCTQFNSGTDIAQAVEYINRNEQYDRLIIFTDDESQTKPPSPTGRGYAINISTSSYGVTYGDWIHINGFSEATLAYIAEYEKHMNNNNEDEA